MLSGFVKKRVRATLKRFGYDLVPATSLGDPNQDFDDATRLLFQCVKPFTSSGIERVAALRQAVKYITDHKIPGDIVECGVWKGGSMMTIARTLIENDSANRKLYLFDTFNGMSTPTPADVDLRGNVASNLLDETYAIREKASIWAMAPLELVRQSMQSTGYDEERTIYVKGQVEETIPAAAPDKIALLRLDTDWYESTYHELVHLFPRLAVGGVLIIDDYGHWQGARRAVDQYLAENNLRLLLNRIDYTGRICVKVDS